MELLQTDAASVENRRYHVLQISTYDAWLPRTCSTSGIFQRFCRRNVAARSATARSMIRMGKRSSKRRASCRSLPSKPVRTSANVMTEIASFPCIRNRYSVAAGTPLKWSIMMTESIRTVESISAILSATGVETLAHRQPSRYRWSASVGHSGGEPLVFFRRGIFEQPFV